MRQLPCCNKAFQRDRWRCAVNPHDEFVVPRRLPYSTVFVHWEALVKVEPLCGRPSPQNEILSQVEGNLIPTLLLYHTATKHFNATGGITMSSGSAEAIAFRDVEQLGGGGRTNQRPTVGSSTAASCHLSCFS